jgi:hypothetical protein
MNQKPDIHLEFKAAITDLAKAEADYARAENRMIKARRRLNASWMAIMIENANREPN